MHKRLVFVTLALAACAPTEITVRDARSSDAVSDSAADSSRPTDSGVAMDAARDTGVINDTGVVTDTGVVNDTGVDNDTGVPSDSTTDAGSDSAADARSDSAADANDSAADANDSAADAASDANDAAADASDARADSASMPDSSIAPGTSPAGGPCASTADCITGLRCDTTVPGGFCFSNCMNNTSQVEEQRQCFGSRSTCLTSGDPPTETSFCVSRCTPGPAPGCRPGQVCTGFWLSHALAPDTAGCFPYCTSNAHCLAGEVCNTRTGDCGMTGSSPTGLVDGSLCTIPAPGAPSPCRGTCFRVVSTGTQGVCGSSIDLAVTGTCPDGPATPLLGAAADNLAYCIFRSCSATNCCPAGLVCEGTGPNGFCTVDDPTEPNIACR